MNAEGIRAIADLAEQAAGKVIEVDGQWLSARELFTMRQPLCEPLGIHTLSGLVDYWKSEDGEGALDGLGFHVVSPELVRFVGVLMQRTRQRECFAAAQFNEVIGQTFKFGAWYDLEQAVVGLQTLFVKTPARDELISIIGNIRSEAGLSVEDDGATQQVTVRKRAILASANDPGELGSNLHEPKPRRSPSPGGAKLFTYQC